MIHIRGRAEKRWGKRSNTAVAPISPIASSKIIAASNSVNTRCVASSLTWRGVIPSAKATVAASGKVHTHGVTEGAGDLMPTGALALPSSRIKDGLRSVLGCRGAGLQGGEPVLIEGANGGVADGLVVAAELSGNLLGVQTALGGAQQLAAAQGTAVPDEFLQHLSPLGWERIILTGEYRWDLQQTTLEVALYVEQTGDAAGWHQAAHAVDGTGAGLSRREICAAG